MVEDHLRYDGARPWPHGYHGPVYAAGVCDERAGGL